MERVRTETLTSTGMAGAGAVLRMIRDGEAVTRADLARRTGMARSTVAQRVDALLAHHLVYEAGRSEEHTSELQSRQYLVCRLLLEKKKKQMPPLSLLL